MLDCYYHPRMTLLKKKKKTIWQKQSCGAHNLSFANHNKLTAKQYNYFRDYTSKSLPCFIFFHSFLWSTFFRTSFKWDRIQRFVRGAQHALHRRSILTQTRDTMCAQDQSCSPERRWPLPIFRQCNTILSCYPEKHLL